MLASVVVCFSENDAHEQGTRRGFASARFAACDSFARERRHNRSPKPRTFRLRISSGIPPEISLV